MMLVDLRDVLESMKNLALVEMGKLSRTEAARGRMLEELALVASATAPYRAAVASSPPAQLRVLIGSERAFCGDFNADVARHWAVTRQRNPKAEAIVVGSALAEKVDTSPAVGARLAGPTIAEDIDHVLVELLKCIASIERSSGASFGLVAIANGIERVESIAILPLESPREPLRTPIPELNLPPEAFMSEFIDHYADAALHSIFATSLLSENRARLARMTVAIDRLDENVAALRRRIHHLRQEEITQEVETILLSAIGRDFERA